MNLIQNNDQEILVPIVDGAGVTVSASGFSAATYQLFPRDRSAPLISKTLGNGISKAGDNLIIAISATDCAALRGDYYHELQVVDPVKGQSTVFNQTIYIQPTEI